MSAYIVIRVDGSLEDAQVISNELEAFMHRMDFPGAVEPSKYDPRAIDALAERKSPVTLLFEVTRIEEPKAESAATAAKTDDQVRPRVE